MIETTVQSMPSQLLALDPVLLSLTCRCTRLAICINTSGDKLARGIRGPTADGVAITSFSPPRWRRAECLYLKVAAPGWCCPSL
mmetsp:Transcript_66706/g.206914  ORF Transcript_66706/g.206914 Transcript_66706/m.206914 type:complete len:84 (-) Transcript_66706:1406-1657(-)